MNGQSNTQQDKLDSYNQQLMSWKLRNSFIGKILHYDSNEVKLNGETIDITKQPIKVQSLEWYKEITNMTVNSVPSDKKIQPWVEMQPPAAYRIIFKDLCFYEYCYQTEPFKPFNSKQDCERALYALDFLRIKITHMEQLEAFKRDFKNCIMRDLVREYQSKKQEIEKQQQRQEEINIQKKKIKAYELMRKYQERQNKNLVRKIQEKIKKLQSYTHILIKEIWVVNKCISSLVNISVNKNTYSLSIKLEKSIQDYLIYTVNEQITVSQKSNNINIVLFLNQQAYKDPKTSISVDKGKVLNKKLRMEGQDKHCLLFVAAICNKRQTEFHILQQIDKLLLKQMPYVHTKYGGSLRLHYQPKTYPIFQQLLRVEDKKLTHKSFCEVYLKAVKFIHDEQNSSQTRFVGEKYSATPHSQRFSVYEQQLKKLLGDGLQGYYLKKHGRGYQAIVNFEHNKTHCVHHSFYSNFKQDLKMYNLVNAVQVHEILFKLIVFQTAELDKLPLEYISYYIPIVDLLCSVINQSQVDNKTEQSEKNGSLQNKQRHFYFVLAFIQCIYPYHSIEAMQADLHNLRWAVNNTLPLFDRMLNRKQIGLQNLLAKYLLHLFAIDLSQQLTLRFWDILVKNPQMTSTIMHALLIYLQSTELHPLLPINQLIRDVQHSPLQIDYSAHPKYSAVAAPFFQQHFLRRSFLKQATLPNKIMSFLNVNPLTKLNITYPLPQPKYKGSLVTAVLVFLHKITVIESIQSKILTISIGSLERKVPIISKNCFINLPIQFDTQQINNLNVEISGLRGSLLLGNLHKNKAIKTQIQLIRDRQLQSNRSRSYVYMTVCLKANQKLPPTYPIELNRLYPTIFQYDIAVENSPWAKAIKEFDTRIYQIKTAIDEFKAEKYDQLHLGARPFEAQWMRCSKVTLQQFKVIFKHLFDNELMAECLKVFQLYSSQLTYLSLGQLLCNCVYLADLSFKKKMTCLFMIVTHYQNTYCIDMTPQSFSALFVSLHQFYGVISAVNYPRQGEILDGTCFDGARQIKITAILQDMAYLLHNIILGTPNTLHVLQSLFPLPFAESQVRLEITYKVNNECFLWVGVVDSYTFQLKQRGLRHLGQHTPYPQIPYMSSPFQLLSLGENVLSLESTAPLSYESIYMLTYKHYIARFLLSRENVKTKKMDQVIFVEEGGMARQEEKYRSWAVLRQDSWMEEWRRCQVGKCGEISCEVVFADAPKQKYQVKCGDVINMQ